MASAPDRIKAGCKHVDEIVPGSLLPCSYFWEVVKEKILLRLNVFLWMILFNAKDENKKENKFWISRLIERLSVLSIFLYWGL